MLNLTMIPWNRRYAVLSVILVAVAALAIFTTVVTVSAQSDGPDWKIAPTGLNVAPGDATGELNIAWDAHPQTTKTLSDYRVTWTPDGESFKTNDQTEWYAYPTTNQVIGYRPRRRRNLPGQGPRPVRRQQKVQLEPRRNRTGRRDAQQSRHRPTHHIGYN